MPRYETCNGRGALKVFRLPNTLLVPASPPPTRQDVLLRPAGATEAKVTGAELWLHSSEQT